MGIDAQQLCQHVIRPTLDYLGRHCSESENLLLGLAASRSGLGSALEAPLGHGLFRISEQLHQWCWDNYLARDPDLASRVRGLASQHAFLEAPHLELTVNLRYATAIACMLLEAAQQDREKISATAVQLQDLLSACHNGLTRSGLAA
jgi:hypothetical protein